MTIVEADRTVIGGVDTHLDVHVAAALDPIGGVLGVESFAATPGGYRAMLEWLGSFGIVDKVGVEGTGAYGAGLARFLCRAGVDVIEVDRPNRQVRRTKGKSDPADAVEAARAVLSGRATGAPKSRDGHVEAIRALLVAKRSARDARLRALHQMRQLSYTGRDQLRSRFKSLSITELVVETAAMRPRASADPVVYATKVSLTALGRRVLALEEEIAGIDELLTQLVTACAPEMLGLFGVGIDTAAVLLVAAGDNPERLRSEAAWAHLCGVAPIEASSGKVTRHRLDRGGDRNANQALWRIVMTRLSWDPRTRASDQRGPLQARGHPHLEALRRPRGIQASPSRLNLRAADLAPSIPAVLGLAFARSADPPLGTIARSIDAWLSPDPPNSSW
jgi:transposase